METLKAALSLISKNCYFSSLDLKDAYFSICVNHSSQGWLDFCLKDTFFAFTSLPNGLASAPLVYTKMLKPFFSSMRKIGRSNVTYIDTSLLKSNEQDECSENTLQTVKLVDSLGFTVHPEKSVLIPTQEITFVGFVLNSINMTVRLTDDKASEIVSACKSLLKSTTILIRDVARIIGKFVSSEPGVQYAPLYYKTLKIEKDIALKESKGDFDSSMILSQEGINCINWWINNVRFSNKPIVLKEPDIIIESESSYT